MDFEVKRDGLTLRGRLDKKTEKDSDVVVFLHGFGCDMGLNPDGSYQKIVNRLLNNQIAVIRFDFNGHGKSDGDFSSMNLWNEIEDGIAVLEYTRNLPWVKHIYLMGHSQGGVVAGMLSGYYPDVVDKLVLLAPAVSLKTDAIKGTCMMAKFDSNHVPSVVNVDGVHNVGGHYFRIAKTLPIFEITSHYTNPAALFVGKYDDVISATEAKEYSECMQDCIFLEMDNLDHGLGGEDQERLIQNMVSFLK